MVSAVERWNERRREKHKAEKEAKETAAVDAGQRALAGTSGVSRLPPAMAARRWQPGQSGNPGGMRPMPAGVREALEAASEPAARRLGELVFSKDERIALQASEVVLSRLFGKPAQQINAQVTTTNVQQAHLAILVELQQQRGQVESHTQTGSEILDLEPNKNGGAEDSA